MKTRIWLLCIAMAVLAVPSYAQQQDRAQVREIPEDEGPSIMPGVVWQDEVAYSAGEYLDNPCTAVEDWTWVEYSAYVESAQAEAGVDRYLFAENTNMGGMYAAAGSSEADVDYGVSFEVRKYHKVNTPDDFHVVTVINFDPAYQYTWVGMETACGNGMPDSAQ